MALKLPEEDLQYIICFFFCKWFLGILQRKGKWVSNYVFSPKYLPSSLMTPSKLYRVNITFAIGTPSILQSMIMNMIGISKTDAFSKHFGWPEKQDISGKIHLNTLMRECCRLGSWVDEMDGRRVDLIGKDEDRMERWWRWLTCCSF